jgi:hypothetical protein
MWLCQASLMSTFFFSKSFHFTQVGRATSEPQDLDGS